MSDEPSIWDKIEEMIERLDLPKIGLVELVWGQCQEPENNK